MGKFLGLKIFSHSLVWNIVFLGGHLACAKFCLKRKAPKIKTYDSNKGLFDYFPRYSTCTIFFRQCRYFFCFLMNFYLVV